MEISKQVPSRSDRQGGPHTSDSAQQLLLESHQGLQRVMILIGG